MMRKILNLLIVVNIFSFCRVLAQEPSMPMVVKPAPTASSLGTYGENPVSNYTGSPSVSIPLYTIQSGEITLPISVSYNTSGIKVTDEASWVGLGWSLSAGGVITRQVVKADDFKVGVGYAMGGYTFPPKGGYYEAAGLYLPTITSSGQVSSQTPLGLYSDQEFAENGKAGMDSEPDIYSYNFLGYSGKLLIKVINNGIVEAVSTDQNNLKFIYYKNDNKWEVTNEKGWKYYFRTAELSKTNMDMCPPPSPSTTTMSETFTTAWYIDQVITPKGDKIDFEYLQNTGYTISFNGISEEKTTDIVGSTQFIWNSNSSCNSFNSLIKNYTYTKEYYLNKIIFSEGYVSFSKAQSNRLDKKSEDQNTINKALSNISIYDKKNLKIQEINFITSYYNQDKANYVDKERYMRLKLDEIIFFPSTANSFSYKFAYNPVTLPAKDSFSIDYWGYYNGADNANLKTYKYISATGFVYSEVPSNFSTLVPFYSKIGGSNTKILSIGADREPNINFSKAGVLSSIIYPTGGKTNFEFESNQYYDINGLKVVPETYTAKTTASPNDIQKQFTIDKKSFVLLEFDFKNNFYTSNPYNWSDTQNMEVVLEKDDGTDILKFKPSDSDDNISGNFNTYSTQSFVSYVLDPGTYRIKTYNGGVLYLDLSLTAKVLKEISANTKVAGGLRINKISKIDGSGNMYEKKFSYLNDEGYSSGKLMSKVFNFYSETQQVRFYRRLDSNFGYWNPEQAFFNALSSATQTDFTGQAPHHYIKISGSSIIPEGSSAGGHSVGYSQVSITDINAMPFSEAKNMGKSVYYYKNEPDSQMGWYLPNLKEYEHQDNGQLLNEKHYNASGNLIKEVISQYSLGDKYSIEGFRIMKVSSDHCAGGFNVSTPSCYDFVNNTIFNRFYKKDIEWWYPSQIIEKNYFNGSSVPVTTTKNFSYENSTHKQLTKEETLFPDGITMNKTYKYADEVVNQLMKDKNMVGIPLVTESNKIINGTSKSLQKVETYFPKTTSELTSTNGLMLPIWTKTYGLNNLSSGNNFVTYDKYDSKGNILQYSTKGLNPTTIIWGYNQTLPIAKIDGISYNELANLFGFSNTPDGYTNLPIVTSSNSDIDSSSEQTLLSNLDSFRSNSNLANYQITTYTYDPIIGLTSITPATGIREFYKYDESNRLNQIIDVNGKILKEYSYHYSNKIPDDVVYSSISGPENINVYTTYLNAQASYSLNLANSPSDLNYYWSISPTTGVSYPSPYNSPNVSLTFNNSGQYKLSLYAIRSSTGESLSLSKTINVNVVLPPEYGSNSMFGINPVQVYTSGIYLNGNSVSGYFVFKPDIINGSKDIALISSDKAPYTDKTVTYHETGTGVDRNWTFIFKTNGVITASYTGTPLSSNSTINVSTFQYQK